MVARFVDASVFVHAYLRVRRALQAHEVRLKERAQAIVRRINTGEAVVTSVVHLAEVANLLEGWMDLEDAQAIQLGLLRRDAVEVLAVDRDDVAESVSFGSEVSLGTSDALAVVLMRRQGLREVYSFDRDFDRCADVRRIAA